MQRSLLLESLINKEHRKYVYKLIYIGISVYDRLLKDNPQLENSEFFSEIKTRILNVCVKSQFEENRLSKEFPFDVEIIKVNKFNNKALFLQNDLMRMQINKTSKANRLCNSNKIPRYMLKEAVKNSKHLRQIKLVVVANNELDIREEKRTFVILGYGVNKNKIDHIEFMIPSEDMKSSIETFNALDEFNALAEINKQDQVIEKQIVELRDKVKKDISGI